MADKTLTSNVFIEDDPLTGAGTWYGPSYGNADKAPADKITNPAAYGEPTETGSGDLRFRADDFAAEYGENPPNLREQAEEAEREQAEAEAKAREAIFPAERPARSQAAKASAAKASAPKRA